MEHFVGAGRANMYLYTHPPSLTYLGNSRICELHSDGGEERVWLGQWLHTQLVILEAGHTLIMKCFKIFYET